MENETELPDKMDYKPTNILLTGGCGFIGSHVLTYLVQKYPQYNFVNLDVLDTCATINNMRSIKDAPNFCFVRGNICSLDLVSHLMQFHKIDTVMHFAAQTLIAVLVQSHVDASFGNPLSHTQSNVLGTHTLLECAKRHKIKRFIHVSTDEVYGDVLGDRATESAVLEPTNPYSCSKAAAEFICKAYMRSYNLPIIITRGNNVYGPAQYPEKVIPKFILRLLRGEKCCLHGDGGTRRSYVHVDDVKRAFEAILHHGVDTQIYNIGSMFEISMLDLARQLVRMIKGLPEGRKDEMIEYVADRNINDRRYYIDDRKLTDLGWSTQVGWEEGLAQTIEWYKTLEPGYWDDWQTALSPHPISLVKCNPASFT